jgi:thiosulfate dehydrogenase
LKSFLLGVSATIVVLVLFIYIGITEGLLIPANADVKPSRLETWAAKRSLHATLAREAPKTPNPIPLSDGHLIAAIKLYEGNCAACHGVADAQPSTIAIGLYQHAPQLAKRGVEDDPEGITYWKLTHGIRLTGMPAFGTSLSDDQRWELALFLKHMNSLPSGPERVWKSLKNPAALSPVDVGGR